MAIMFSSLNNLSWDYLSASGSLKTQNCTQKSFAEHDAPGAIS
jgi:hypothetical protein